MNRVTHPYAKVPYHAKAYPGSRYPIGRNPSLHFRPRYRPSYYEQDSYGKYSGIYIYFLSNLWEIH